jgi:hypothetical protein
VSLVAPKVVPSTPAPNPQAEARRDYELALQIGNKDALNAFVAQYPDGFYANLARIQLAKLTAEETRLAATEKARLAEQERARLAAEGTQKQLKAAEAEAKAAEQARIAAEKAKQVAQEQASEAERKRVASETPATGKESEIIVATANPGADRAAASPPIPDNAQQQIQEQIQAKILEKAKGEKAVNVASLSPEPPRADLTKALQTELRRVGCLSSDADGEWSTASQRSMALFNRNAKTKFEVKLASVDALEAIKLKQARVCPLICQHGFEADGDRCSKIVCGEGSFLNDDNECEKRRQRTPTARRDREERPERLERADRPMRERPRFERPEARASVRPQAGGQIVCDRGGCRPVERGCHLEFKSTAQGGPIEGGGGNVQVCH